jgi:hypothetical protein
MSDKIPTFDDIVDYTAKMSDKYIPISEATKMLKELKVPDLIFDQLNPSKYCNDCHNRNLKIDQYLKELEG